MQTLADIEKRAILERVARMDYNVVAAARSLGIGKSHTYRKMKLWGLSPMIPARLNEALRAMNTENV